MIGGPAGALLGAGLGSVAGQFVGGMFGGERQMGTSGATGQLFEPATKLLKVEQGERVLNPNETAAVNNFSTDALEAKMTSMVNALTEANKSFANVASGVNTLVAVESRALKAVEKTARKEPQVGMV